MGVAGPAMGHSGAGPGSVCAIYHFPERGITAGAFAAHPRENEVEAEVKRLAML